MVFIFRKITNQKHWKIQLKKKIKTFSITSKIHKFKDSECRYRLLFKLHRRRWFFRCERQPLHSKTICGSPDQKKKKTPTDTETEHIKETEPKKREKKSKNEMERTTNSHRYRHTRAYARVDTIFWFARATPTTTSMESWGREKKLRQTNEGERECVQKKNESTRDHQHHHY